MSRSFRLIRTIILLGVMLFMGVMLVQPALAAPGDIHTAAGSGSTNMPDGLYLPRAVHMTPAGEVYVADTYNHRILKVLATGVTATVAGNGYGDFCGDGGPAIDACLFYPSGIFVDTAGNIFIADTMNDRVRKIDTNGIISTVTGYSMPGYLGDGGPAADALLNAPTGVVVSASGEVFIADATNNAIRKIDAAGAISTAYSIGQPYGLALDPSGTLFVSTQNYGVYKDGGTGLVSVPSCSSARGVSAPLTDTVYMACPSENKIMKSPPGGPLTSVAGTGTAGFSDDGGAATAAKLDMPWGVAADQNGGMHVADSGNNRVRVVEVTDTTPPVTTAMPPGGAYIAPVTVTLYCYDSVGSGCGQTYFCIGAGCSSFTSYSVPITFSSSDVLRFYSVDNVLQQETIREQTYTIDPLAGWYVHSVMAGGTSNVDWYAGQHTVLAPNTYVLISGTYYLVEACASGSWSEPALFFNSVHLSNCDQITGQPLGTYPDLTNMVGRTIEHFSTWPVAPPAGWKVHARDPSAQGRIDWYAGQNAPLAPGNYVFLNWTYYYVAESGPGSWNDGWGVPKAYYNYARLQQCNQSTGQPLTDGGGASLWADTSWFAGITMRLYRAWNDPQPPIMINNGVATTYAQTVALSLSCDSMFGECVAMRFSNDAGGWSALEPFLGLKSWSLGNGSGLKTVTAQFRYGDGNWSPAHSASIVFAEPATLTVSKSGNGSGDVTSIPAGISCGVDCSEVYQTGAEVFLSFAPSPGSYASSISGDPGCDVFPIVMNGNKNCTITFSLVGRTLTVENYYPERGTITSSPPGINCGSDCTETYTHGTQVALSFAPATGWALAGFAGDQDCLDGVVTMDADKACFPVLMVSQHTLTVQIAGSGTGMVMINPPGDLCGPNCSQTYDYGTQVTLHAWADPMMVFTGWSGACSGSTGDCTVLMDQAKEVTVTFGQAMPTCSQELVAPRSQMTNGQSINDQGELVYAYDDASGNPQIHSNWRGQLTSGATYHQSPSINNLGDVVWAQYDQTRSQIYVLYAGSTTPEALTTSGDGYDGHFTPVINDNREIVWSQFKQMDNFSEIFSTTRGVLFQRSPYGIYDLDMNKRGDIVWSAYNASLVGQIYRLDAGSSTPVAVTSGTAQHDSPAINDSGEVVWNEAELGSEQRLYSSTRGLLATACPAIGHYYDADLTNCGEVIFKQSYNGQAGIYKLNGSRTCAPATGVTLVSNIASPLVTGPTVTFTAMGSGGSGSYEYQFIRRLTSSSVVEVVQGYSTKNTWTWPTAAAPAGSYYVRVDVRNVGSVAATEASNTALYSLVTTAPVTGVTLVSNIASPLVTGPTVTFTAMGSGGSGSYEYQFIRRLTSSSVVE
ncbi:MAG: hypothetical protein AABZ15_16965, partial [Nitrospirota bacterium]